MLDKVIRRMAVFSIIFEKKSILSLLWKKKQAIRCILNFDIVIIIINNNDTVFFVRKNCYCITKIRRCTPNLGKSFIMSMYDHCTINIFKK